MENLYRHTFTHGLSINPPNEPDPQPRTPRPALDIETRMRNIARVLVQHTEVKRRHNGRGRCATYAADVDAIAQTGRQLAELVLEFCGDTEDDQESKDDNGCPF